MNELPTHDAFRSQIQKIFTVVYDKNCPPEILTLQSVSDISAIGGGFGGYGMTFSAPLGEKYLIQKQWPMHNDVLGDIRLFLVPGGPHNGMFEYNVTLTFRL